MSCARLVRRRRFFFVNVEHDLVRAYFEENNFLVSQVERSISEITKKKINLAVFSVLNTDCNENPQKLNFRVYTGDLNRIRNAHVTLLSWQDTSFSNGLLNSDTKLLKFFHQILDSNQKKNDSNSLINSKLDNSAFRLLVVPALPKIESKCQELFHYLKSIGFDGVFTLSSILENLLRHSITSNLSSNYGVFHLLKLLKTYGLATEPQLDIFNN